MNRPTDWDPLWGGDPTPGDPEVVLGEAGVYGKTADDVATAARMLRRVTNGLVMRSDAVDAFLASARKVHDDILKIQSRYAVAAGALKTYGSALQHVQAQSLRLLGNARDAGERRGYALNQMGEASNRVQYATDPVSQAHAKLDEQTQRQNVSGCDAEIAQYQRRLEDVIAQRDAAARVAGQGIDDAVDRSPIGVDSTYDKIRNEVGKVVTEAGELLDSLKAACDKVAKWIAENGDKIASILSEISTIVTVVGIVISFIPGVDVAAPFLLALGRGLAATATIVQVATLASKSYLAARGKMSWSDVAAAGLGMVATFGVGRVVGSVGNKIVRNVTKGPVKRALKALARRKGSGAPESFAQHRYAGMSSQALRNDETMLRKIVKPLPKSEPQTLGMKFVRMKDDDVVNEHLAKSLWHRTSGVEPDTRGVSMEIYRGMAGTQIAENAAGQPTENLVRQMTCRSPADAGR